MEILHLQRHQIDDQLWDNCVDRYSEGRPYALCAYLDIVCDRNWEALVTKDYQNIFPLPFVEKIGLKFYSQPFLCQQLGLIGNDTSDQTLALFCQHIPRNYAALHLKLNATNNAKELSLFKTISRSNYVLDLNSSYENIQTGYSKSLRKRIAKGKAYYSVQKFNEVERIAIFYQEEMEVRLRLGQKKYKTAEKLMQNLIASNLGYGIAAKNDSGQIEACLFLVKYKNRIINLFGTSNQLGKEHFAMHVLLDHVIQNNANSSLILDFEGSDIPGVKEFYQSFGPQLISYPEILKDQSPFWYRLLKKVNSLLKS